MLERILIPTTSANRADAPIDLGLLAEAMLFYGNVSLTINHVSLEQLVNATELEQLDELLRSGLLELKVLKEGTGMVTENSGSAFEQHKAVTFGLLNESPNARLSRVFAPTMSIFAGRPGKVRRVIDIRKLVHIDDVQKEAVGAFEADVKDRDYTALAAASVLSTIVPECTLPNKFYFHVYKDSDYYTVDTNLDLAEANEVYHRRMLASHSSITHAYILSNILTAREELIRAAHTDSELAVNDIHSTLSVNRIESAVTAYTQSKEKVSLFQEVIFGNARAIRAAIESGTASFRDCIPVILKSRKWHAWLRDKPMDVNLVNEYYREVVKETWIDKLPSKGVRFVIFQAAGAALSLTPLGPVGIGLTAGLGAVDSFLIDRIAKGWRPNHFVEGALTDLLKGSGADRR